MWLCDLHAQDTGLAISTNLVDIDLSVDQPLAVKELPSATTMDVETNVLTTDFWLAWWRAKERCQNKMPNFFSRKRKTLKIYSIWVSRSSSWSQSDFDPLFIVGLYEATIHWPETLQRILFVLGKLSFFKMCKKNLIRLDTMENFGSKRSFRSCFEGFLNWSFFDKNIHFGAHEN